MLSTADEAREHMEKATDPPDSGTASSLELRSERLRMAVSRDGEAGSLLQSDSWMEESESARTAFFSIILCILVLIVCMFVAGILFAGTIGTFGSCVAFKDRAMCLAFLVLGALGGLVIYGAFCMAVPVGIVALIGAVGIGFYAPAGSILQKPDMKLSNLGRVGVMGRLYKV
ncbi:unnamed protein product [Symbiodinium sp. CCMP2592]|nr:unnamed protein product [Symbiodinium sp. CCMP2592]